MNDKLGKKAIANLLKSGYNENQIGEILMNSLSETLWDKMTFKQKAEYNNDIEIFRKK